MLNEQLFDFLAAGNFLGGYVSNNRNGDIFNFNRSQNLCQTVSSGLHQSAVERSAYWQQHSAFCTCSLQSFDSFIYRINSTSNNNLTGAVEVYCLHCFAGFSFYAAADFYDFVAVQAQNSSHAAFAYRNSLLHELAAFVNNAYSVSKFQSAGVYQCAVFAQAVASSDIAAYAMLLQNCCTSSAGSQDSGLGVSGQLQVFSRTFEAHFADGIAKSVISLFKNLFYNRIFIIKSFAHANGLRTLAREYECDFTHRVNYLTFDKNQILLRQTKNVWIIYST